MNAISVLYESEIAGTCVAPATEIVRVVDNSKDVHYVQQQLMHLFKKCEANSTVLLTLKKFKAASA